MAERTRRAPSRKVARHAVQKKTKKFFLSKIPWAKIFGVVLTVGTLVLIMVVWSLKREEATPVAKEPDLPPPQAKLIGSVAVVLDDAGYSLADLEPFLELPFPLAVAILPFQPHSSASLEATLAAGKTALLHMPMEPLGSQDPGIGALFVSDPPEALRAKLGAAIESLPGIVGINNHMGSKLTSDLAAMRVVLDEVESRGFFFLDSYTHATSVVKEAASLEAVSVLRRDVFADNSNGKAEIDQALAKALDVASTKGSALVIGHVGSPTLAAQLRRMYEDNRNRFHFVAPQDLLP